MMTSSLMISPCIRGTMYSAYLLCVQAAQSGHSQRRPPSSCPHEPQWKEHQMPGRQMGCGLIPIPLLVPEWDGLPRGPVLPGWFSSIPPWFQAYQSDQSVCLSAPGIAPPSHTPPSDSPHSQCPRPATRHTITPSHHHTTATAVLTLDHILSQSCLESASNCSGHVSFAAVRNLCVDREPFTNITSAGFCREGQWEGQWTGQWKWPIAQ